MIYGFADTKVDVIGISIARETEKCKYVILETLKNMERIRHNKYAENWCINVIQDTELMYAEVNSEIYAVIKKLAISDGFFLDPIYNAKAFYGMEKYIKNKGKIKDVLYLNTGGTPNIFVKGRYSNEYFNS